MHDLKDGSHILRVVHTMTIQLQVNRTCLTMTLPLGYPVFSFAFEPGRNMSLDSGHGKGDDGIALQDNADGGGRGPILDVIYRCRLKPVN